MSKALILCIGNRLRRDDGIGPAVGDALREKLGESAEIIESWGEGTELMQAWEGRDHVIAIDAALSGTSAPGTIHTFQAHDMEIPQAFFRYSTHRFALAEAVELSRSLGSLPNQLTIFAIEGENFDQGEGLSPTVEAMLNRVIEQVLRMVA